MKRIDTLNIPLEKEYLDYKKEELLWLADFSRTRMPSLRGMTYFDLLDFKLRAKENIKYHFAKPWVLESNILPGNSVIDLHGWKTDYCYQRQDISFEQASDIAKLYPNIRLRSIETKLFFTSSCQNSISVLLDSLADKAVRLHGAAYWETLSWLRQRNISLVGPNAKAKAHYIDSSVVDGFDPHKFARNITRSSVVFFDTTCLSRSDARIGQTVDLLCEKKKCLVVLIRSHIKLDCLATEYGRLGSVLFCASTLRQKEFRKILESFQQSAKFYGTLAQSSQIYPFLSSKEFLSITDRWLKRYQENNRIFSAAIQPYFSVKSKLKFISFDHGLFSFFCEKADARSEVGKDPKYMQLMAALEFRRLPSLSVASYPWDFIGVTQFRANMVFSPRSTRKEAVYRVSLPDFGPSALARCIEVFQLWIQGQRTRS